MRGRNSVNPIRRARVPDLGQSAVLYIVRRLDLPDAGKATVLAYNIHSVIRRRRTATRRSSAGRAPQPGDQKDPGWLAGPKQCGSTIFKPTRATYEKERRSVGRTNYQQTAPDKKEAPMPWRGRVGPRNEVSSRADLSSPPVLRLYPASEPSKSEAGIRPAPCRHPFGRSEHREPSLTIAR